MDDKEKESLDLGCAAGGSSGSYSMRSSLIPNSETASGALDTELETRLA